MASKPKQPKAQKKTKDKAKELPTPHPVNVTVVVPPSADDINKLSSRNKIPFQSEFTGSVLLNVDKMIDYVYEVANAVTVSNGCTTMQGVSSAIDQYVGDQEDIDDMIYPTPEHINAIARRVDMDLYFDAMPEYFTESAKCDSNTILGMLVGKWIEFYGYNSDIIQDRTKQSSPSMRNNVPLTALHYDEDKIKGYDFKVRAIKMEIVDGVKTFKASYP